MIMNTNYFDKWSLAHLGVGSVFGYSKVSFPVFLAIAVGWEILEPTSLVQNIERFIGMPTMVEREAIQNQTGDVISDITGYLAGYYARG